MLTLLRLSCFFLPLFLTGTVTEASQLEDTIHRNDNARRSIIRSVTKLSINEDTNEDAIDQSSNHDDSFSFIVSPDAASDRLPTMGARPHLHQQMVGQKEVEIIQREGEPPQMLELEAGEAPPWWQSGNGPRALTDKSKRSRTFFTVALEAHDGKLLSVTEHRTLAFIDGLNKMSKWNLLDTGEGLHHMYIQSAYVDKYVYLCEDEHRKLRPDCQLPTPWKIEPSADGYVKLKSGFHHEDSGHINWNYLTEFGGEVGLADHGSSAESEFKATLVSVGWGRHDDPLLVSPTSAEVYLVHLNDNGTVNLREGGSPGPVSTSPDYGDEETWTMLDAGSSGWTYLRSHSGGYLHDKAGVLDISNWTGYESAEDPNKWHPIAVPAGDLPKVKFMSQTGRDLYVPFDTSMPELKDGKPQHQYNMYAGRLGIDNEYNAAEKKFSIILKDVNFQV